ncbi:LysR substrate-binding domain-containing protein [Salinarimonas soli]|uniref:LysR family transcriptional regulator n=1 Tax=Salinarimonas soli TaxID=1638099 RepID=A0A5B2VUN3_9HYPH|nr:LysR substrate-binding domain-containing protein [Salinarimonas soli]KAA2242348.1 LysR family transcriptional regulator [Salinarimonas soli]
MRTLPPFDGLVAFEAVVRHGSATRAAVELDITQSAVSHRLRRLEAFFSTPLLVRAGTRLGPSPAGVALAAELDGLFEELSSLRARCRAAAGTGVLKVAVGAALADLWLVRRLPAFAAAYPGVAVELVVLASEPEARRADADVQIRWLPPDAARNASTQRVLFVESVFPVCAPDHLPGGRPLDDPGALLRLPLLHKGLGRPETGAEWLWRTWFERLGLGSEPPAGLRFETLGTAIAAALQGAGAVIARSLLVHDALHEGRLSRVLDPSLDMRSSKAHVVRWPPALIGDARVSAFVTWLVGQAEITGGAHPS